MSDNEEKKSGYKTSFVDEDELNREARTAEAIEKGKEALKKEESVLFQKLNAIVDALTEKEQGAVYQLEGIKSELNTLNKNFDAFFNFLAKVVSDKPQDAPKKAQPPKKPSKPAPTAEDKLKKMIGPKFLEKLHIEDRGESFALYIKGFIGGDFGTIKELFVKNGGGWVPKTGDLPEEAGYFGIAKEDL